MWSVCFLWACAKQHVSHHHGSWSSFPDVNEKRIAEAISLAKDGLLGKACQILTSSGLAPNTEDTWSKLSAKHPRVLPQFLLLISHFQCPLKSYHQTSISFGPSLRLVQLAPQACASNTSLMCLKFKFLLPFAPSFEV